MGFTDFLQVPELAERYQKVRKLFFLKESTYDITSICQLRCEGCYYYAGEKDSFHDNKDPEAWRAFFEDEKKRGITFAVCAGAEPALAPDVCQACYDVIPLGTLASNGLKPIPPTVGYKIQLSVWGDKTGDPIYRKFASGRPGPYCLPIQLKNYKNDSRVIFIYTFNSENTNQVDEVIDMVGAEGHRITFNVFSSTVGSDSPLKLRDMLKKTREKMFEAIEKYGDTIVYSYYAAEVHTDERSLHDQFGCIYPRAMQAAGQAGRGIGVTFRSHRSDFSHKTETDCCVPDMDCADCRHYGSGSAIIPSRLSLHGDSEKKFRGWLDYVDTYLEVFVNGYRKDYNLYTP
jgi:hypothetical protein